MGRQRRTRSASEQPAPTNRGGSTRVLVTAALLVVFSTTGGLWLWLGRGSEERGEEPIPHEIIQGPYQSIVLDQGVVESSNNIEIRCDVRSRNSPGTTLLEVVAEGTSVEPGDLLALLDSSALESERDQQQVIVNTSEARVIQTKADFDAAEIAKQEYLEGTFKQEEQTILNEIFEAEENLRKAEQYLKFSERLAAKGYVTALQLEADRFAVQRAKNALDLANRKLDVLRNQTKTKMLIELNARIDATRVAYDNEQKSHKVEVDKLADINKQIEMCRITVPPGVEGQVVHANQYSRRGGSAEFVVQPGAFLREKQAIIRIPDMTKMQVKATVNESRITRVSEGMPVTIQLDALQEKKLRGNVIKVNKYPEPEGFGTGGVKRYGVVVEILDPPAGDQIRPGMNASVSILVEQVPDAIQIPLQAIFEFKGHTFCLVKQGEDEWETREIKLASNNERFARVVSGVKQGEIVILNPRHHVDKLQLPDLPDPVVDERVTRQAGAESVSAAITGPTVPEAGEEPGSSPGPLAEGNGRPDSKGTGGAQ